MKTNLKHTEGEWKILWGNYTHFATINKDVATRICAIEVNCSQKGNAPIEEAEANAKLIAAAPELLDSLNELFNLLEENEPQWYLKGHYNRAIKALQKATL